MPITFTPVFAGLLGGVLRGLVGYYKNQTIEKMSFNLKYFLLTIGVSALVGGVAGALVNLDWRFAFVAGYAGTDFIEGVYKTKFAHFADHLLPKSRF